MPHQAESRRRFRPLRVRMSRYLAFRSHRTEEEIGVDDLKAVEIPNDVTEKFQKEAAAAAQSAPAPAPDTT